MHVFPDHPERLFKILETVIPICNQCSTQLNSEVGDLHKHATISLDMCTCTLCNESF